MGTILKERLKLKDNLPLAQEALLNLFVAQGFLRLKYEQIVGKYKITISQFNVLRILNGVYPDGHARCDIIQRMIEPNPDVTRILDKLEKERFVERFMSNEDRRFSIARITKKGISLLEEMKEEMTGLEKVILNNLTDQEKKELSRICEKIYG